MKKQLILIILFSTLFAFKHLGQSLEDTARKYDFNMEKYFDEILENRNEIAKTYLLEAAKYVNDNTREAYNAELAKFNYIEQKRLKKQTQEGAKKETEQKELTNSQPQSIPVSIKTKEVTPNSAIIQTSINNSPTEIQRANTVTSEKVNGQTTLIDDGEFKITYEVNQKDIIFKVIDYKDDEYNPANPDIPSCIGERYNCTLAKAIYCDRDDIKPETQPKESWDMYHLNKFRDGWIGLYDYCLMEFDVNGSGSIEKNRGDRGYFSSSNNPISLDHQPVPQKFINNAHLLDSIFVPIHLRHLSVGNANWNNVTRIGIGEGGHVANAVLKSKWDDNKVIYTYSFPIEEIQNKESKKIFFRILLYRSSSNFTSAEVYRTFIYPTGQQCSYKDIKFFEINLENGIAKVAIKKDNETTKKWVDKPIKIWLNGEEIEVSPDDNAVSVPWGRSGVKVGASSFPDGMQNSKLITTKLLDWKNANGKSYACKVCDDLVAFGHSDWYLPAIDELTAMYNKKVIVVEPYPNRVHLHSSYYWSSTEETSDDAWYYNFGGIGITGKFTKNTTDVTDVDAMKVRCIRKTAVPNKIEQKPQIVNTTKSEGINTATPPKTVNKPQIIANKTVAKPNAGTKPKLASVDKGEDRIFIHPFDNAKSVQFVNIVGRTRSEEFGFISLDNGTNTTKTIVDVLGDQGGSRYACYVCDTLHAFGYDDWYLPAAYEFKLFSPLADSLNLSSVYWTSTFSKSPRNATAFRVQSGQLWQTDMLDSYNVRCVRREKIFK